MAWRINQRKAYLKCRNDREYRKIVRIEMLYNYTKTGMKWVFCIDENNNIQYMLLTVVGIEKLNNQSPRRKTIQFMDILTGKIITMQANCMPQYMKQERIDHYKKKLTPQERERIEEEEKKIKLLIRRARHMCLCSSV